MTRFVLILASIFFLMQGCKDDNSIPEGTLLSKIDEIIEKETDFNGVVHIGTTDAVSYSKGFGFADRENQIAIDQNTVFDIGSITKPFTAMGIIKCQELGLLEYQDALYNFFPEAPEDKKDITIEQLLTHSSGLIDAIGSDYDEISKEAYLEEVFKTQLLFSPGERYTYSNIGFSLLGIIIETVSNASYEEFLNEQIFDSSAMKTAGYLLPDYSNEEVANGYDDLGVFEAPMTNLGKPNEQPWDIDGPYWHLKGNGGLLMSANDITKYYKSIKANLINEVNKQKMYTKYIREDATSEFYRGYGWGILDSNRGLVATHNGGNDIFFADFAYLIEQDLFIFLASNSYRQSQDDLLYKLLNVLSIEIKDN